MTAHIALLRKDVDSDFGVDFPDFLGCITGGTTLREARDMAIEALSLHVEGILTDGESIPEPSTLDQVMADLYHADAVAILIDLPTRCMGAAGEKLLPVA